MKTPRKRRPETRRTTLTIPEALLRQAEQLARKRHQTLSAVVADLVEGALRNGDQAAQAARRRAAILNLWTKAYAPLTEEEMLLVDGVVLEDRRPASR
ncbi:MAG: hypothetical protein HY238_12995 [Acidobacteria bacterium]|nr:hypothetical protein [Acidobacteriota bacterium]